jgi:flagellar biosynthesis protein FlhB
MSEEADKESKTEDATEKRINDAVEKGQVAFSREIPILASLLCFTVYFSIAGSELAQNLSFFLGRILERAGSLPLNNAVDAIAVFQQLAIGAGGLVLPFFLVVMAGGLTAAFVQSDPRFVADRIVPKYSRISPTRGWQRIFGLQGFVEFLKSVAKFTFAAAVAAVALRGPLRHLLDSMFQHPAAMLGSLADTVFSLLTSVCAVMAAIAAFDFFWARFSWRRDLKMTRQEIKDEHKQSEGDPMVKARIRSIGRDRARRRMLKAVPQATLIIANPTHFSVALRYQPGRDAAPVVVAKGQDILALRIREIAESSNIPVFEQVELARALYRSVQIDQMIPPAFYLSVSELIRLIYKSAGKSNRSI